MEAMLGAAQLEDAWDDAMAHLPGIKDDSDVLMTWTKGLKHAISQNTRRLHAEGDRTMELTRRMGEVIDRENEVADQEQSR